MVVTTGGKRLGCERGFTLVEVLIASFILATTLLALSTLFALGLKNNAVAKEDTVMASLAQGKLEQLRRISRSELEKLFPTSCQGPCETVLGVSPDCDETDGGWATGPAQSRLCYPAACAHGAATFTEMEDPISDPNPDDRVKERMYVRLWEVQKVNLGLPVGCVYKLTVTVGSRNGLFAPVPTTATSWLVADSEEVVGSGNPRRILVSAFRR